MNSREIMEKLAAPFPESAISWRAGATNAKKNGGKPSKCIALAYIDARDVMQRLDEVFAMNWMCSYSHADKKTICEISVLIDGVWVSRANGAGDSDIEAEKGAISDAFKRAAVMFGIGRYLYNLPNEWVDCDEWGQVIKPPRLPAWARPQQLESFNDEQARQAYEIWELEKQLLGDSDVSEKELAWFKHPSNFRTAVKRYGESLKAQQELDNQNQQHIKEIANGK